MVRAVVGHVVEQQLERLRLRLAGEQAERDGAVEIALGEPVEIGRLVALERHPALPERRERRLAELLAALARDDVLAEFGRDVQQRAVRPTSNARTECESS